MKKITLTLLISLLSTNILFSMEKTIIDGPSLSINSRDIIEENEQVNNELPFGSLENVDEVKLIPLMLHIDSILDISSSLDEMIDLVAKDFENSYAKSPKKDLYIQIFRTLAKQKFTSEFNNGEVGNLKIMDLNHLSESDSRELFIKTILSGTNFNLGATITEHYETSYSGGGGSVWSTNFRPLFTALVELNHITLVKLLVICGVNINTHYSRPISYHGCYTALYYAAAAGNIPMATLLINLGANVNFSRSGFPPTSPALMGAVRENKIEMCELLIKMGANVNYQDELSRHTCLDIAEDNDLLDIQALLIQHGAKKSDELSTIKWQS